jgi:RNA polymerase sigma factor for flagellar operon FliA
MSLEQIFRNLDQRLGHPAGDKEICDEMKITLKEFHRILDRNKGLDLGSFQPMVFREGGANDSSLLRYYPDPSHTEFSLVLRRSEIRGILTRAIEELPMMERLVASLHYYDELTLKEIEAVLGIDETCVSQLHTKAMLRLRSKFSK